MDISEYIAKRVDPQIAWYSKKSKHCQKMYRFYQILEIILASMIPLLSSYSNRYDVVAFIVGLLGASIAAIESITKLFKFHENWIQYRTTCEILKSQKHLFLTSSYPYNDGKESKENVFIKNIESVISSENAQWHSINTTDISGASIGGQDSTGS